jgi:erythromycin esterase
MNGLFLRILRMKIVPFNIKSSENISTLTRKIGDVSVIMMGEASHGTHEYYVWRASITKKLIEMGKISFIAVEGDWPDCYKVNRYVKGYTDSGANALEVLQVFNRWPTWMWANWEVAAFVEWLRSYNSALPMKKRVGFYGLDVYSLWESLHALVNYLEKEDPEAARAVKKALRCFEPYKEDGQEYGKAVSLFSASCHDQVLSLLTEVRMKAPFYNEDPEASLNAEQNAYIAVNAEEYYRSMVSFDNQSWNIRDRHMIDTLNRLMHFHGWQSRGIVWEHNTHIGDARATDMKHAGMVNTGQLAREKYGEENVFLLGFGSYEGTVIASYEWGASMEEMAVPPARKGSIEEFLHRESAKDKLLLFDREVDDKFSNPYPHRAIGVVYHPGIEMYGNYVPSVMSARYNAFLYIDKTHALHPLNIQPEGHKTPETYPFGL